MINLSFGHLGNGITVWSRDHMSDGDYLKIAHINRDRQVTYYKKAFLLIRRDALHEAIQQIEDYSNSQNPTISETQLDEPVFFKKV